MCATACPRDLFPPPPPHYPENRWQTVAKMRGDLSTYPPHLPINKGGECNKTEKKREGERWRERESEREQKHERETEREREICIYNNYKEKEREVHQQLCQISLGWEFGANETAQNNWNTASIRACVHIFGTRIAAHAPRWQVTTSLTGGCKPGYMRISCSLAFFMYKVPKRLQQNGAGWHMPQVRHQRSKEAGTLHVDELFARLLELVLLCTGATPGSKYAQRVSLYACIAYMCMSI